MLACSTGSLLKQAAESEVTVFLMTDAVAGARNRSSELAVLAAATVVAAGTAPLQVALFLAGDTQADAGHRHTPRHWNCRIALFAALEARSLREFVASPFDAILDGGIDLILHGAVARPAGCHGPPSPPPADSPIIVEPARDYRCNVGVPTAPAFTLGLRFLVNREQARCDCQPRFSFY